MVREILLLGNPQLYEKSEPVRPVDIPQLSGVIADLHDTLFDFRQRYGAGRAIAAPQIGVAKRILYMHTGSPIVFINPELSFPTEETMDVLDDCMSFPHLLVKVRRYKQCTVRYTDEHGKARSIDFQDDLAELIQHEYDHLDGILATMRAVDAYAFYAK